MVREYARSFFYVFAVSFAFGPGLDGFGNGFGSKRRELLGRAQLEIFED